MKPAGGRIGDIEALRAFAILLVLAHHLRSDLIWWETPWKTASMRFFDGGVGVGLFLVVSGFVIGRSLFPVLRAAAREGRFRAEVVAFWLRRFWRLIPSAWVWLLLPVLFTLAFNASGAFGTLRGNLLAATAALCQVANFYFRWASRQGDPELTNSVFVYWSLSLEEQFYLLLPFLVFVFRRRLPGFLALLVVSQLLIDRRGFPMYHVRTEELFTGLLLAYWQSRKSYRYFAPEPLGHGWLRVAFVTGSLVMLCYTSSQNEWARTGYHHVPRLLIATGLVWVASYDRDYIVRGRWLKPAINWMGARSYSLYLIHVPSFFLAREVFHRLDSTAPVSRAGPVTVALFVTTAVLLSGGLAELNFRFLEVPLRRRGREIAASYLQKQRPRRAWRMT